MRRISIGGIIYIIIGVIVASNRGYITDLTTLGHIISAFVAILLWPVLLLGANLHLAI
ncbi:MAG: hypothetical protein NVSMB46_06080 [Candidatus Saccharimonadales bacterium]